MKEKLGVDFRNYVILDASAFIIPRLSKVPQPGGQKRALRKEIPANRRSLTGTNIAEIVPDVRVLLLRHVALSKWACHLNVGGSVLTNCPRQEIVMKSVAFFLMVLCALIIGSVSWETRASDAARKQSAVTNFD